MACELAIFSQQVQKEVMPYEPLTVNRYVLQKMDI